MATYVKHLSEPWFTFVCEGKKTQEGKLNTGFAKDVNINDVVTWFNDDVGERRECKTIINNKNVFPTFVKGIKYYGIINVLPSYTDDLDEEEFVKKIYYKYYKKEDEMKYGVVMLSLKII